MVSFNVFFKLFSQKKKCILYAAQKNVLLLFLFLSFLILLHATGAGSKIL